ncbi:MAG: alpha/beta fold hydrolase [Nocardioides sp.]|nr:alpha/beta fold hydrolase [Nocardioides sp.]
MGSGAVPTAVVLVLHGGKEHSTDPVTARSLSWQRGAALGRALGRRLRGDGVAVRLLRYRTVGWNGDGDDKVADARWALDRIGATTGEAPIALVGHSMGGRTACRVADHPLVRGVVALAPWLPPAEPVAALAGRQLYAAHGRRDRITSAADTRAYVERARAVAGAASFTDMGERGHYLLSGLQVWNGFALDRVRQLLG